MMRFFKNELDGVNDRVNHVCHEYKFCTQKFILQSVCLKSLCTKNAIFGIIPAHLQQFTVTYLYLLARPLRPIFLDLSGVR